MDETRCSGAIAFEEYREAARWPRLAPGKRVSVVLIVIGGCGLVVWRYFRMIVGTSADMVTWACLGRGPTPTTGVGAKSLASGRRMLSG
jgi:hypothetical protein